MPNVLLPCLHDADEQVRSQCEEALHARGLTPQRIRLGWLATSANPVDRNKVFDLLLRSPDLDLNVWLQNLSHNDSWSVRSNTLSAMALVNPEGIARGRDGRARSARYGAWLGANVAQEPRRILPKIPRLNVMAAWTTFGGVPRLMPLSCRRAK